MNQTELHPSFVPKTGDGILIPAGTVHSREKLVAGEHFGLWRHRGNSPFTVGEALTPRVLVCTEGTGRLVSHGCDYAHRKGDAMLLPAVVGARICHPRSPMEVLEISLPQGQEIQ